MGPKPSGRDFWYVSHVLDETTDQWCLHRTTCLDACGPHEISPLRREILSSTLNLERTETNCSRPPLLVIARCAKRAVAIQLDCSSRLSLRAVPLRGKAWQSIRN